MGKRVKSRNTIKPLIGKSWVAEWQDMPEFVQETLEPYHTVLVRFRSQEDVDEFANLIEQKIPPPSESKQTKSIWYPKAEARRKSVDKLYVDEEPEQKRSRQ
jgi:hypothetical protein